MPPLIGIYAECLAEFHSFSCEIKFNSFCPAACTPDKIQESRKRAAVGGAMQRRFSQNEPARFEACRVSRHAA